MLLERGMAKEALAAFEATKAKEPNRFQGYAGTAMAAEKAGDATKAKDNYRKLIALAEGDGAMTLASASTPRPALVKARAYLAGQ
jgi:Tfp pilus assembly protein PilF